jgi:hypothetical protein
MFITIYKEDYEYWENYGHIIVRSLGPSGTIFEIPLDCCVDLEGYIIPFLLIKYIKDNILIKHS